MNVGTDSDTAEFAVKSISRWWEEMGEWMYSYLKGIKVTDAGMADPAIQNADFHGEWNYFPKPRAG